MEQSEISRASRSWKRLRQLRKELGRENTLSIHVTWLPYIEATSELKTKPTQHSVRELRSIGIQPDMIVARSDQPMESVLLEKIALFCDVEKEAVIPMETTSVLYEIPLTLEQAGVADFILRKFNLKLNILTGLDALEGYGGGYP